jgi:hypothetical protein
MTTPVLIGDATLYCEVCGGAFNVKPYRRKKARFCSQKCGGVWHAKARLNTGTKPYMLGNKHRVGKRPANAFTSDQVRGEANPRWQDGTERECEHCGQAFRQKPWLERQNGPARFCGPECFVASDCFVGEKSPTWVGGPQTYRGRGWKAARAAVVAEQNGTCADCSKVVGESLPVHHRKPFRLFASAEEANQRSNLVGLCQSCHMKAERQAAFVSSPAKPVQEAML